jgi:3-deoxy-D-manno-octulosonate 8-phosphate phosphatase (KDO 8-P phosphatase)
MTILPEIEARAKKIKLIAMDVDGVLTGGEIIFVNSSEEIKIWNVRDGMAFHLAHRTGAGIKFAWITGRSSKQVEERAAEMGIHVLQQNCMKKKEALEDILRKFNIQPDETAYLGDDLVDVPVFRTVGLSVCPSDACEEVKKEAHYMSGLAGGKGVLREVVEIVLKSRGLWGRATEGYL